MNATKFDRTMKFLRLLIWVHASYILVTAVWPILDIESFMRVTGEKRDVWLVKTVGALLIPVAACLYSFLWVNKDIRPAIILGGMTCISFATIDLYYALNDVIPDVYLADAFAEMVFLMGWLYVTLRYKRWPE